MSILNSSRSGHRRHYQQRSMNILRDGMQRPRSKQHNVRQSLRRTCLRNNRCAADSAAVPVKHRPEVETDDVSMATDVTSVKTHAEMNPSEPHQAHGDPNGSRRAKSEEENRRQTSRKHVFPEVQLITKKVPRQRPREHHCYTRRRRGYIAGHNNEAQGRELRG